MLAAASRGALRAARTSLTALAAELPEAAGIDGVSTGLFGVVRLLDRSGQLRRVLGDPTTAREAKESLLESLLGSQLDPLTMRVLKEVVGQRWSSPRDLVDAAEVLAVQAAFLVAEADGSLDEVEDELFRFSRILARDSALRAVLTERGIDSGRKDELLDSLLADRARPETLRLITSLVAAPRGRTLEDGLAEYARLAAEIRERSVARVTSAVRLTEGQEQRLSAALARTLGRNVQLQVDIDAAVIGGLVVRVGDEVIDGTTRHHLNAARVALTRR